MQKPNGLVLAGGNSLRMQQDKGNLMYHAKPQNAHIYDLLVPYCTSVFISRKSPKNDTLPCIYDNAMYQNIGPIAGLLSAFEANQSAWLVVAIDYPFFADLDIEKLLQEREKDCIATVYFNPETQFFEPFLGIYEADFFVILQAEVRAGNHSLQKILQKNPVKKVIPHNLKTIKSIDTFEEYLSIQKSKTI